MAQSTAMPLITETSHRLGPPPQALVADRPYKAKMALAHLRALADHPNGKLVTGISPTPAPPLAEKWAGSVPDVTQSSLKFVTIRLSFQDKLAAFCFSDCTMFRDRHPRGRLAGRHSSALCAFSVRPMAAVLATVLVLSGCGGGDDPQIAQAPVADPAEFTDGFLVASAGSGNYTPLLQLAGNWQRCEDGAQYNVTLAVADAAAGSLRLHSQFVDYFANAACTGGRVARAERVVSGSTTPLEIAIGYTGGTLMSRDYVLPPTNQAADTVFWRVTYTAPAHVLRLSDPANAGTVFAPRTISGQPHQCFDRAPLTEVCLPDVPAAAQSANSWRAIHLQNALTPDAMYLFTLLPQRPPAVLETWYLRQPV